MSPATLAPNPFAVAADYIDPPAHEYRDRPSLEPHQVPPQGFPGPDADFWLLEAGRGAGKTEACSRYFDKWMSEHPGHRGRIIAPTFGDAVESCIRGPSGLLSINETLRWVPTEPGGGKVHWGNGSEALVFGTPQPRDVDRFRASGNRHLDWWEEMAANPQLKDGWDQAAFGLRLGNRPHAIGSSTPRGTREYKKIRKLAVISKATLFDNPHLLDAFKDKLLSKYEGTRLGRQELYGELLDDVEGALWTRAMLDNSRIYKDNLPDLAIVTVAIDPAATSKPEADDTGITVQALGTNGEGYIIEDRTCHLHPDGWGHRAIRTLRNHQGDYIVGEVNNGGEMVETIITNIDPSTQFRSVVASRGKATRAQPVAALWGDGKKRKSKVHIVGSLPELEDQLVTWVPGDEDSPDRLDAMVWGITDLMLSEDEEDELVEYYEPVKIGADI